MNRIPIILALALLLAVGMLPAHAADATARTVPVPHDKTITPAFSAVSSSPQKTTVQWSMAELTVLPDTPDGPKILTDGPRGVDTETEYPVHGGMVAMPWGMNGAATVQAGEFYRMNDEGELEAVELAGTGLVAEDFISFGESAIFRDITVAPLNVTPVLQGNDGALYVAAGLQIQVQPTSEMPDVAPRPDRPVSRAFAPLYESVLLNELDDLGLQLAEERGSILIVIPESYHQTLSWSTWDDGYTSWYEWKQQKGYNLVVETWDDSQTALGYGQLQQLVSDAWQTFDPPLEYVVLYSDVMPGDTQSIPVDLIDNPNFPEVDATDWPLVFLEGDDYFPEVFIGRMSVTNSTDAYKLATRTVGYEKNNYNGVSLPLDDEHWTSANLVAGNYNSSGGTPLTPVAITEMIGERMMNRWGFTSLDELYWNQGDDDNATAQDIIDAVDDGGLWTTYRGYGNEDGWVHPLFTISDVEDLNNPLRLGILTTFVCNTGDFANTSVPQCFAESWILEGELNQSKGAVAAVGPTDLQTQTPYNNALISGFFYGVYEDNLTNLVAAMNRAQWELYLGFPTMRGQGQVVEFYHHIYHVLGDPELTIWRGTPREMTITAPTEIALGQGHITVSASDNWGPVGNGYVTAIQGETVFHGGFLDNSGSISLPLDDVSEGELLVTITAPDRLPEERSIQVTQQSDFLGVSDWTLSAGGDGLLSRGETGQLVVDITNSGLSNAGNVTLTLSHPNVDKVDVISGEASLGSISAGGTASNNGEPFEFELTDFVFDNSVLEFDLTIDSDIGQFDGKLWVMVGAEQLQYAGYETQGANPFEPGETATLRFRFENNGSIDLQGIDAVLSSFDEAVTGISGSVTGLDLPAGESAWVGPFDVTITDDTYRGRPVALRVSFSDDERSYGTVTFNVALEGVSSTDPLGPDGYGYFAYDDTDTNENAPSYQWFNLDEDPSVDNHFQLLDDENVAFDLPMDFQYYGEVYPAGTTITLSSNGWISLAAEDEYTRYFFRNWHLPSIIGPDILIAPFWDDLGPQLGELTMNVYTKYDAENGRLIIEWSDAINRWSQQQAYPAYVALVLYAADGSTETGDSVIEVYFEEVVNIDNVNNFATIGLEKPDKSTGLQYTYAAQYPAAAAPVADGRAIRFTTNPPDNLSDLDQGDDNAALPGEFKLYPAQPNPFNSTTVISFDLPDDAEVKLGIYNLLGQEIASLVDRRMQAGHKEVVWQVNDRSLSSGMLLIRLNAGGNEQWGKMMYVK